MDRGARLSTGAHLVCGARVVSIGKKDFGDSVARERLQIGVRRLDGVNAEIPLRMLDEITVKVVAMGLRKPRPGENSAYDLFHAPASKLVLSGACPDILRFVQTESRRIQNDIIGLSVCDAVSMVVVMMMVVMRVTTALLCVAEDQGLDHNRHRLRIRQLLSDIDKVEVFKIDTIDRDNPGPR
jgi:hypothetical protein